MQSTRAYLLFVLYISYFEKVWPSLMGLPILNNPVNKIPYGYTQQLKFWLIRDTVRLTSSNNHHGYYGILSKLRPDVIIEPQL